MAEYRNIYDKKYRLSDVDLDKDPIEAYGFGVVAYFSLLKYLAKLFAFLSILAFILIYIY